MLFTASALLVLAALAAPLVLRRRAAARAR
jgi:hypothetical protein